MVSRSKQLDVLRTAAVLLVIGHHWAQFVSREGIINKLMMRVGWVGVDLFFVLSGFLVSGLLFREYQRYNKIDIVRFFIRRGLKIYPGFYVFLLTSLGARSIIQALGSKHPLLPGPKQVLSEAFFVQNYFSGVWNHTWSLAVEEHFYLLLGLSIFYLSRKKLINGNVRTAALITGSISILCLLLRALRALFYGYDWFRIYAPTHARLDALLFGVFLAYAYHYKREKFERLVIMARPYIIVGSIALVSTCVVFKQDSFLMYVFGLPCLSVGFGGIMMTMLFSAERSGKRSSAFTNVAAYLGQHSYSVYLWHMPVLLACNSDGLYRKLPGINPGLSVKASLYVCASFIVGIVMAKLVEMPALKIRDRLYPSRSGAALTVPIPSTETMEPAVPAGSGRP